MNLDLLRPEICLAVTAVVVIAVDLLCRHKWLVTVVSIAGLLASAGLALSLSGGASQSIGNGLFALDAYAIYFKFLFLGITLLAILASVDYVNRLPKLNGEFHALVLTAALGAMLTAAAQDIISIFLSIELTAISLYALVAMLKNSKSSESAVKYILLGAVNSAILLFGLALVFGFSGATSLHGIWQAVHSIRPENIAENAGFLLGSALTLSGLAFKIAAVPFHMWAPDVYEGSPTPITLFLSTVSKLAGFSILARFVIMTMSFQSDALSNTFGITLAVISAASMTAGNLLAIKQHSIKRLLAYSSIAQSGYMLMLIATAPINSSPSTDGYGYSLLCYMIAFALAELAVFTVIIIASKHADHDTTDDYAGLAKRSPLLACAMTLGLLSLMGMPPLVGFLGKFCVFIEVAQHGLVWLVIIAVVNSVISAYYYLKIIRTIWMEAPASTDNIKSSIAPKLVLLVSCFGLLLFCVLPMLLIKYFEWLGLHY
ncbi:MAG: NADH-quinone oxidoreductase subunit N [Dehalococcoidia bacterium]|nr:NADH-quinone oxidoreductase subunit N [Dehalococcoidia bacterium]